MFLKIILFLALFFIQGEKAFSSAEILPEAKQSPYISKFFTRLMDKNKDDGTKRLDEIDETCQRLEGALPDDSLNLFLGRSVGWFAAAQTYRLEQSYSTHPGSWIPVHFSGGSDLEELDDDTFYTRDQLLGYRDYLTSLDITPRTISTKKGGLYLIDYIMMGRTMCQFSKLMTDWCTEETPDLPAPLINFIDISFSVNYRKIFGHEEVLSPPPTQFLLSDHTMNPLIHSRGPDDIGKDHSLICSFKPKSWTTWKMTLKDYRPSDKALGMHDDLKNFLDHKYKNLPME